MLSTESAVRSIDDLAVGLRDIDFFGVGIGHQPAVLERTDNRVGERIAAGPSAPMASSVSENSSLANLATASSKGPARTGSAVAKISNNAHGSARKFLKKFGKHWTTPAEEGKKAATSPPSPVSWDQEYIRNPDRRTCWSLCCSCRTSCRPSRRSGPWNLRVPSTRHRQPPGRGSSTPHRTGRWL